MQEMARLNDKRIHEGMTILYAMVMVNALGIMVAEAKSSKHNRVYLQKGIIKTIKGQESGDVIDCIDIYKQPAFDHPLLKNHTIQMKPTAYPKGTKIENFPEKFIVEVECPEGTVPIIRTQNHISGQAPSMFSKEKLFDHGDMKVPLGGKREYAMVTLRVGQYFGGHAGINVWKPATENGEASLSQISVMRNIQSIEAGWMVNPFAGFGNEPRFFAYWTADGYNSTGCFNVNCPGFVLVSQRNYLGGLIKPISQYNSNGKQYIINVMIHQDRSSGNWWLRFQDEDIGYWPPSIIPALGNGGDKVSWGGQIMNSQKAGHHTTTQMGSGHFPSEGFGKASYFRTVQFVDGSGNQIDAESIESYVSNPSCYDLHIGEKKPKWGVNFYYGGSGYSAQCP